MPSKLTTEIFINKAKKIHGDRYDYSEAAYINLKTKMIIFCKIHGKFLTTPNNHLNGKTGCPFCAGNIKKTSNQFIEDANKIHNNKYDYSESIYLHNKKKIKIKCHIHGIFEQTPNAHLNGQGCMKCGGRDQLTTDIFNSRSSIVHNNFYDYSKVSYISAHKQVEIICPLHGSFKQRAVHHLYGKGCYECGLDKIRIDDFIPRANKIHNNKYNYSKIVYKNSKDKIPIICPIHGEFYQLPQSHLNGNGCANCYGNKLKSLNCFIEQASIIHNNKYNYSQSTYINSGTKIKIICPNHGLFEQPPSSHLAGSGCLKCSTPSVSKAETKWLDYLNIDNKYRQKTIEINNKKYRVDAYIPETNTIYEFYGDYWHGNLNKYNPEDINHANKQSFKFLNEKTINREEVIKMAGYTIISIWESEFKKLIKQIS